MISLFRPNYWIFVLLAYFALHGTFQFFLSGTTEFDRPTGSFLYDKIHEVAAQLPLSKAQLLALQNNIILFLTFAFIFQTIRRFGRADWAWVTTLCLFFIPQVVWVSQHSDGVVDLATLASVAVVCAFAWLLDHRNLVAYGMFGAAIGMACLTSMTAMFVVATLLAAAATHKAGWKLCWNWRMWVAVVVALMWSAPQWGQVAEFVAIASDQASALSFDALLAEADGLHIVAQATLSFAGFLAVGIGLLFHHGLGGLPRVDQGYLDLRQILARQLAIAFVMFLILRPFIDLSDLTYATLRPVLILLVPLAGLYLAPLLTPYMREMIARGAVIVAAIILLASPAQYSNAPGGITAWYLELRASEDARTPLL